MPPMRGRQPSSVEKAAAAVMVAGVLAPTSSGRGGFDGYGPVLQTGQMTGQSGVAMQTWPVQDAKARFSEFLDACLQEGPQMVTRRGAEAAVLITVDEWRRLQSAARPSLKQLLLSDDARADLELPARGQARRRKAEPLP
ncbi:type II toxin-antitoxin system Phd/YefM family antitoxin [Pseudaquabacterium rugosum]|uniref:Antitoxin n=1 Tax=Pseudaquabacterium rugosum TaxID=2984194 RepID=A0ABU9BFA1_9BURK